MSDEPKVGKTFTIDMKVNAWLHYHAKETKRSQSYIVNALLNSAKRRTETWICPECSGTNLNDSLVCYANASCEGIKETTGGMPNYDL